jgi:ankyrin repeat protein
MSITLKNLKCESWTFEHCHKHTHLSSLKVTNTEGSSDLMNSDELAKQPVESSLDREEAMEITADQLDKSVEEETDICDRNTVKADLITGTNKVVKSIVSQNLLLHYAARDGNFNEVRRLVQEDGAKVDYPGSAYSTLGYVARFGSMEMARFLVENGADIELVATDFMAPLAEACLAGNMDIAKLLIENGANISAKDIVGWTALHRASENGHLDIVRLLVEKGADVTEENKIGDTPLDRARAYERTAIAQFLEAITAKTSSQSDEDEDEVMFSAKP